MTSKNIKEYVIEKVLETMRYRDIEIIELRSCLADVDIVKCGFCECYRTYDNTCEFCDIESCDKCQKVSNYSSWNLSGCDACDKCSEMYCTGCRLPVEDCVEGVLCK